MGKTVVISTSSLNSYGFRVLTSGIDIVQYQKNPIVLWMHNRPMWGKTDEVLPIGKMTNVRKEGDHLVGELEFDPTDDFAKKIEAKWDAGIIKMVSAGLAIKDSSTDAQLMAIGQTRPTVTKSKLVEVSVVDIGANDDAVALYNEDSKMITLAAGLDSELLQIQKPKQNMNEILKLLGLPETATESEVAVALTQLQQTLSASHLQLQQLQDVVVADVVDCALKGGKIDATKKEHFVKLGQKIGVEDLRLTLDAMPLPKTPPAPKITDFVANGGQGSATESSDYKTLSDVPVEQLEELRKELPDVYAKLYKVEYGVSLPTPSKITKK